MDYALIMAGGSGTRLWPLSRQARPKQALRLVGERSMFQHTVDRLAPLYSAERIFVVTRREHRALLQEQAPELPAENFIVEPEARGTAPAIGLAAVYLQRVDPQASMAVLTADHWVAERAAFHQALRAASEVAGRGFLVTLGIRPANATSGYGYIEAGEALDPAGGLDAWRVRRFVEKPNPDAAREMVQSGRFSWNSGMFAWRVGEILAEFARQMPVLYENLLEIGSAVGTAGFEAVLERVWPQVTRQTIDYGIMEGAQRAAVIPVEIGWTDVGSWGSLQDLLPADGDGNILVGPHLGIDTHDTLALGERRLIATIGVQGLVIVDTEDALLVCPRAREQEVRDLVARLEQEGGRQWL